MSSYPSGTGESPAGDGRSTAIQKLVFEIEQALDLLSQMAPGASDLAEEAKITVRSALKAGLGMGATSGRNSTFTGPMDSEGASGGLR